MNKKLTIASIGLTALLLSGTALAQETLKLLTWKG